MRSKVFPLLSILVVLPIGNVSAQETLQDTLDWHGYYPLEVGNVREVASSGLFGHDIVRNWIVTDTTIDGKQWFVQATHVEGEWYGDPYVSDDTLLLRYDDQYGRVLAWKLSSGEQWDETCDLSQDFNAAVQRGFRDRDEFGDGWWILI